MKSHRRHHNKNIYGKSTLSAWCQDIQGKGWRWICIVRVTLRGIEKEIEEVRLLCCPGCVFGLIRQPLSFLTILPVRKRQSSLTNVILRPYYAVYLLE
jgi:hypothetical protein